MLPVALVVIAAISQELGAAYAVTLFAALGPLGTVFARLAVSGLVLCAATRPRIRGLSRRAWAAAAGLAGALAVMNTCFYFAIARIPLGVAVTIEVLGPLILSVIVSARRSAWIWALLAFAGVALLGLTQHPSGGLDLAGAAFAGGAAVAWAVYILASARTGAEFPRLDGLALATTIGALAVAPFVLASASLGAAPDLHAALRADVLGLALAVGVMSSVIPYSLELVSLRRLSAATFAVLTCLSPVTAAAAGWLVLDQELGISGYLAIALVSAACVGAVRSTGPAASIQL